MPIDIDSLIEDSPSPKRRTQGDASVNGEAQTWQAKIFSPHPEGGGPFGGRDNALVQFVSFTCKKDLLFEVALEWAQGWNRKYCSPPLSEDDVHDKVGRLWWEWCDGDKHDDRTPEDLKPKKKEGPRLTTISNVQRESVSWLWQNRIPFGKLTLLDGDPGLGKSTVALTVAAQVTIGGLLPGNGTPLTPGDVLLLSFEDGLGDTIRPRLEAAGADLTRVHVPEFPESLPDGSEYQRPPVIPDDLPALRSLIEAKGVKLIIVDPLMAALSGDVNSYRDQDVRRALAPLSILAEETGVAVLVLRHMNKGGGGNALYRGGGSIGITGAARSVLLMAKDPDDEEKRVIAPVKNNLSKFAPSLSFRLEDYGDVGRVVWEGESPHSANALAAGVQEIPGEAPALEEAVEFLLDLLADGPVSAPSVQTKAKNAGIKDATLRRAKEKLHIRSVKHGFGDGWGWELPPPSDEPTESPKMLTQTGRRSPILDEHLGQGMSAFGESRGQGQSRDIITAPCENKETPDIAKALMETRRCSPKMDERLPVCVSIFGNDDEPEAF